MIKNLSWQIILAAFLLVAFVRNLLLPIIADDYSYAFIWDGAHWGNLIDGVDPNNFQRVESFSDILASQWEHYFHWGGRTIAHIFVQFFVWQGKIFFDVANVFMLAALVILIFKVGTGLSLREMNKKFLVLILAGIWFCAPALIITTVWLTGACNYLWMSAFELLFLLPFALAFWRKNFSVPVPLMALLGLIAGWSIEPGSAVTVFAAFMFCVHFWRKNNLQPWMKIGFAFALAGFAILILSPGNFARVELTNTLEPDEIVPPDAQWTPEMFLINFVIGFLPVFARELILFVPVIYFLTRANRSPDAEKFVLTFSAASILVLLVMMFSPEFPERAGFPSTIFLLVAATAALKEISPQLNEMYSRHVKRIGLAVNIFVCAWILSMLGCLYVEKNLSDQLTARMDYVEVHRSDDLITVAPLEIPAWSDTFLGTRTWDELTLWWGGDLEADLKGNRDIMFAKYHGLKKIVAAERKDD